jgi:hypothetical protein
MKVYILEWSWSDGYESSNAVIGAYTSVVAAEKAYAEWRRESNLSEYGLEEYEMRITEMEVL